MFKFCKTPNKFLNLDVNHLFLGLGKKKSKTYANIMTNNKI